jgi:hypothetical protein
MNYQLAGIVKKLTAFCATRRFIAMFTSTLVGPLLDQAERLHCLTCRNTEI